MKPGPGCFHDVLMAVSLASIVLFAGCTAETADVDRTPGEPYVNPRASFYLGKAVEAMDSRSYLTALSRLDSAAAYGTQLPEVHFVRGQVLFEMHRYGEARNAYHAALARKQDFQGVWHNLGNISFEQGRFREALMLYRREADLHDAARPWHAIGGTLWSLGKVDSARIAYEEAISRNEAYAPAHASLAEWYESGGDFEEALLSAQRAMDLAPENLDNRRLVGLMQLRTGAVKAAIQTLRGVADARAWDYSALFGLGQALRQAGRLDTSGTVLDQAEQIRSQQQVVERLERTAGNQADNFQAQVAYGNALRGTGRMDEAIQSYHLAMSLRPGNLALQNNLATMYIQRGDAIEASERYRTILGIDSTFAEAWLNLGLLHLQNGEVKQANESLRQAEQHGADNPRVQSVLARLAQKSS